MFRTRVSTVKLAAAVSGINSITDPIKIRLTGLKANTLFAFSRVQIILLMLNLIAEYYHI